MEGGYIQIKSGIAGNSTATKSRRFAAGDVADHITAKPSPAPDLAVWQLWMRNAI